VVGGALVAGGAFRGDSGDFFHARAREKLSETGSKCATEGNAPPAGAGGAIDPAHPGSGYCPTGVGEELFGTVHAPRSSERAHPHTGQMGSISSPLHIVRGCVFEEA